MDSPADWVGTGVVDGGGGSVGGGVVGVGGGSVGSIGLTVGGPIVGAGAAVSDPTQPDKAAEKTAVRIKVKYIF